MKFHYGVIDYRVPFILRLPRAPGNFVSPSCFNTAVATALAMAVLEGSVATYRDVEAFILRSDVAKDGSARSYCAEHQ